MMRAPEIPHVPKFGPCDCDGNRLRIGSLVCIPASFNEKCIGIVIGTSYDAHKQARMTIMWSDFDATSDELAYYLIRLIE